MRSNQRRDGADDGIARARGELRLVLREEGTSPRPLAFQSVEREQRRARARAEEHGMAEAPREEERERRPGEEERVRGLSASATPRERPGEHGLARRAGLSARTVSAAETSTRDDRREVGLLREPERLRRNWSTHESW